MSVIKSVGKFVGTQGANVWEGSRLASTQFSAGVAEGYTSRSAELRKQRAALGITTAKPAPAKQKKVATA